MASTWCCSCFCRYLIEHGAHVGAINSEGELPLDVATEDAMERLLKAEIKKQGVYLFIGWSQWRLEIPRATLVLCVSAPQE